jgi:hypothetical protein
MSQDLQRIDLSAGTEKARTYRWVAVVAGVALERSVRVDNPREVFYRPGGETHRVVDKDGVVAILPAPGTNGCWIVIEPADPEKPAVVA